MDLASIRNKYTQLLSEVKDIVALTALEKEFLGADSELNKLLRNIQNLSPEDKKTLGRGANEFKAFVTDSILEKTHQLRELEYQELRSGWLDITFTQKPEKAHINPLTTERWLIEDVLSNIGFEIMYPYEIDSDENNFDYVNIPKGHPARDAWDTFFTTDGQVAITHTSSMQHRILKTIANKIDQNEVIKNLNELYAFAVPGKCFRNEATDARHEHTFNQIEGVVVGKNIKFTDMLGIMREFFSKYFAKDIEIDVTPDYFPFVEPGNGIAIRWNNPDERILKITKGTGWLEVLGCGMIHPNVLSMAGIDPDIYTGFAWGGGIERVIMIKNDIEDLRLFHSGNSKFLKQF